MRSPVVVRIWRRGRELSVAPARLQNFQAPILRRAPKLAGCGAQTATDSAQNLVGSKRVGSELSVRRLERPSTFGPHVFAAGNRAPRHAPGLAVGRRGSLGLRRFTGRFKESVRHCTPPGLLRIQRRTGLAPTVSRRRRAWRVTTDQSLGIVSTPTERSAPQYWVALAYRPAAAEQREFRRAGPNSTCARFSVGASTRRATHAEVARLSCAECS